METCRISWLTPAFLKQPTVVAQALDDEDEHALDCLSAGLPV
jgi:hypothetical protein